MARVIKVIEAVEPRGMGVSRDPHRLVKQYFTEDGELLAENDPCSMKSGKIRWVNPAEVYDIKPANRLTIPIIEIPE